MSRKSSTNKKSTNGKSAEKANFDKTQSESPNSEASSKKEEEYYDEVIKIEIKFSDLINLEPLLKLIKLLEKDLEQRQKSAKTSEEENLKSEKVVKTIAPIPTDNLTPKKFDKERKRREYVKVSELN
ncbi:unnamed protein product [Caenorhabditis angaria]|uniref:Uncharacterized protein n=1 Tax=Caenorhabditis angaria TaxID=860376 RepID=A0A9P1IKX0_9PELO|nr:unnamed protein product [Caenorhabditis angaria]